MKPMSTPRRLLDALIFPAPPARRGAEPVLQLDQPPPHASLATGQPLGRRAVERALEEGSRRVYLPMREAEVIETPRGR